MLPQGPLVETPFRFVFPLRFILLPKRAHMQVVSDLQILVLCPHIP